jgi:hypothetical protein
MSDGIIDQLSKYGDHDEEESWRLFKAGYMMKSPEARVADLRQTDLWLEQETQVTKNHASLLTRKRELESIHRRLRDANR